MYPWNREYDALIQKLPQIVAVAKAGDTGNPEDDLFAKVAIVAFGRYAPSEKWTWDHLLTVRAWRAGDYSDEALHEYGVQGARNYALFACAWLGTVLGLREVGAIDTTEALRGEALLAGYVAGDAFRLLDSNVE